MGKLIAIGEALIDFMPAETGRGLSDVTSFIKCPGGSVANVAVAAARLDQRAVILTQLGDDAFGDYLCGVIGDSGVDVSAVARTKDAPTGLAFVSLRKDGEREFIFYRSPSADVLMQPNTVDWQLFARDDILHFCTPAMTYEPMRASIRRAVETARERGMLISFDPNLRFPLWPSPEALYQTTWEFIPHVDILKVGADELEFITRLPNEEGIGQLLDHVQAVLVTYGGEGAAIYTGGRRVFLQSYDVRAVDTTGAGDAFIGAFLTRLLDMGDTRPILSELSNMELLSMLRFSHAVAGLVVSAKGAINAMPDRESVERFMVEHNVDTR